MKDLVNRRAFMKIRRHLDRGWRFHVAPLLGASAGGRRIAALLGKKNGEAATPSPSFSRPWCA